MALNPFFLQGSPGEQRLVQELINEQLKIYGVEVSYIPRKFVKTEKIIREVTASKFDDNYSIEAYVSNYEGYGGAGDILTKFGMNLKDELTLIISRERFEDFIAPFLQGMNQNEIVLATRPKEGDLIFFPLGKRLFEVKFVEHEQPFYQLGKTYVYELKCELFELEDEIGGFDNINTTVEEIDKTLQNQGYITSLQFFSNGQTATATAGITSGYVRRISISNDGFGYVGITTVSLTPAPPGGVNATAVAITTSKSGSTSLKEILIVNPGSGYTVAPKVTIFGAGSNAKAVSEIVTNYYGIGPITITTPGNAYINSPRINFSSPTVGLQILPVAKTVVGSSGSISSVLIRDAGIGYTTSPSITIDSPPLLLGTGDYKVGEFIVGQTSGSKSKVREWYKDNRILNVGIINGKFSPGEIIVGSASSATYELHYTIESVFADKYEENDEIQTEGNNIIDFSESNPFGNY